MKSKNIYGATHKSPYHLAVSAIVLDSKQNIICLYYPDIDGEIKNSYLLFSGTMEENEDPIKALKREAKEELGYETEVITFLGTQVVKDKWWGEINQEKEVEKTTLFFLAKTIKKVSALTKAEGYYPDSKIESVSLDFLIKNQEQQQVKDGMRAANQLLFIQRAKEWLKANP